MLKGRQNMQPCQFQALTLKHPCGLLPCPAWSPKGISDLMVMGEIYLNFFGLIESLIIHPIPYPNCNNKLWTGDDHVPTAIDRIFSAATTHSLSISCRACRNNSIVSSHRTFDWISRFARRWRRLPNSTRLWIRYENYKTGIMKAGRQKGIARLMSPSSMH